MGSMKFTDRFLIVPIKIYDKKQADLVGSAEYFDGFMKILPFEISNYKPMEDEDNDNVECVSVTLKNGDNFYVYFTVDEFEKALNDHQAHN